MDAESGILQPLLRAVWMRFPIYLTAQARLQFGTVALDAAPDCRVVCLQDAFAKQLFDIAERERVPQVPTHGAKNQLGLGLALLEKRRSDCLFHDLFRLLVVVGQGCDTTGLGYVP